MQLIDDRYELLEVIASGGMATVWRARDTRLDRLVAVKRPHPGPPGGDAGERMNREARAAASLSHPNLVTVYDFGTDDSGPYLVMELVDGPTLQELAGEITPEETVDLAGRLADALAVIHAAGVVHRDVKPGNVIMSSRGPLLTDFGIAFDPNATAELTEPGKVVATPSYAAPEVLKGEPPTAASDVFSLAVMVDELITSTGARPSRDVADVIAAGRANSPEDRPSAAGFAAALRGAAPTVSGVPAGGSTMVLDAAPSRRGAGDERRTNPGWVWVAGLLVLLIVGLAAIALALTNNDPPPDAAASATTPTSAVVATTTTSTSTSTTTTSTSTTTTTTPTTTTLPTAEAQIADTRDELESILLEPPRSDMNPSDVEKVMERVDEAIVAANDGDLEEAAERLSETGREIEEKVDDENREEAIAVFEELVALLGFEIVRGDDGNDDGDD